MKIAPGCFAALAKTGKRFVAEARLKPFHKYEYR
jgi:hypothetical protein